MIETRELSRDYPMSGGAVHAVRDVSITVGRGQLVALKGRSGSGKTTFLSMVGGLDRPTRGSVTVDGLPISALPESRLIDFRRRRVGFIFQAFGLMPILSAAENVEFGAIERAGDRDAVVAAAERAGADEVVAQLGGGWDTVLSRRTPGGTDLSGGQWQRVALARALFAVDAGASVLILDEPTAALDVRAEAEFYDRFLEMTRGTTTIVISHRFSTVRRADRIVVLDGGRVVEDGDHDSLLLADGRYAEMFRLQATHFATGVSELDTDG